MHKLSILPCLLSINLLGAEYTLTFDIDPNGKAAWQNVLKEYRGRSFTVDSREKYLKLVNAKARVIITINAMEYHVDTPLKGWYISLTQPLITILKVYAFISGYTIIRRKR